MGDIMDVDNSHTTLLVRGDGLCKAQTLPNYSHYRNHSFPGMHRSLATRFDMDVDLSCRIIRLKLSHHRLASLSHNPLDLPIIGQ